MIISELILKIKAKPELNGISDEIVKRAIENNLKGLSLSSLTSKDTKLITKLVRKELRTLTGQFRSNKSVEQEYSRHYSIRDREEFYPLLKKIISSLEVKSILDLGCGINPLFVASKGIRYHAFDIREDDLKLINEFFDKNGIDGETKIYDLRYDSKEFPITDLTLIMNVLDGLDTKGHKKAEEIILRIKSKFILVSFPLVKLSGKPMNYPKRGWFEKMIARNKLYFNLTKTRTELWYLVSRELSAPQ